MQAPVPPVMIEPLPLPVVASVVGWVATCVPPPPLKFAGGLNSATTFCWFVAPKPSAPTPMKYEWFCQNTLLSNRGTEKFLQLSVVVKFPAGQTKALAEMLLNDPVSAAVFRMVTNPATCGHEAVPAAFVQLEPGALASGAPRVLNSGPADAVESLDATVLLMKRTARASWNDTPPPSHPATLFTMMLLVTRMLFQGVK